MGEKVRGAAGLLRECRRMMRPITFRAQPVVFGRGHLHTDAFPRACIWWPRGRMHPACDPRNPPPPEGWHWQFRVEAMLEMGKAA